MEFYLTLSSNSSMAIFKDNTTTRFTTLLPKSISLDGSWECALVEIHFLMALENMYEKVALSWETTSRIMIHSGPKASLHVSDLLALQLGFEPGIDLVKQRESTHKPTLSLGYPSQIYVYCDTVEQQLIGDVVSPLLRIVSSNARGMVSGQEPDKAILRRRAQEAGENLKTKAENKIKEFAGAGYKLKKTPTKRQSLVRNRGGKTRVNPTKRRKLSPKDIFDKNVFSSSQFLDLFSLPPTQTSIEGGQWVHYKPVSSLSDDAPLEFVVPGHGDDYVDLSHTLINITACITGIKDEESAILYGPVNLWLHSLFSQVDVFLNQKLVTPSSHAYPYRAYIETLLNYGPAAKNSHLTSALWYSDTPGSMDDCVNNAGAVRRRAFTADSKEVERMGHLHCDLFNHEKFLPNGVEMWLKLVRSKSGFNVMSARQLENVRVRITDASLLVRRHSFLLTRHNGVTKRILIAA
ncbi:hypothetical protein J437_LFUL014063 [Ladona fulva]|uniref:Uncharacterized protein n=1 Tax=Ladona fulva TaxID=123851 RepID=A0A8K0KN65_LADFU|nr:hypothetical protein J437_LFUL014063 [Ladona fulva]